MAVEIRGVTTIRGSTRIGPPVPVAVQDFLTNQTMPAWLDVSGMTSANSVNRTVYDSTGKLTYAPNNQAIQSQTFNNAAWTTANVTVTDNAAVAPDGTTTAANVVVGASTAATTLNQTGAVFSASSYIISVYIKKNVTTRYFQLRYASTGVSSDYANFDLDTGTVTAGTYAAATITSAGSGWYRISMLSTNVAAFTSGPSLTFIPASNSARGASYTGNSTDAVYLWGAQLERVTYQTTPSTYNATTSAAYYGLRFDYDPSTLAAKGLLIEESRTNICLRSQEFDNAAWNLSSATATANTNIAPDGTLTADTIIATASTTSARRQDVAVSASTAYTFSLYVYKGTGNTFRINLNDGATNFLQASPITWTAGVPVITTVSGTWSVTDVGNGWYRIRGTATTGGAATTMQVQIYPDTTAGTGTLIVWGAQLEAGAFATSYIPTTSAAVTRAADIVKLSGAALTAAGAATGSAIIQTSSTLYASKAVGLLGDYTSRRLIYYGSNTEIRAYNGSVSAVGTIGGSGSWVAGPVRAAVGWSNDGFSIVANNGTVATQGPSQPMGTAALVYLGYQNSTNNVNGWIAQASFYNQRLPDATLQAKSVVGSAL